MTEMIPAQSVPIWFADPPLSLVTNWYVSPLEYPGKAKLYRGEITIHGHRYFRYVLTDGGNWREALDFPYIPGKTTMPDKVAYSLLLLKRRRRREARARRYR